jgi:selenocysteine lyase/cysteine desulfurase
VVYLDNASDSHPKPPEVYREVERALRDLHGWPLAAAGGQPAPGGALLAAARAEVAALLGRGDPACVVFTCNGTDALNMAIKGLLRPGDHAVTTTLESQAVGRPLTHMQMGGQISLTRLEVGPEGRIDPAALEKVVAHRTRLVVVPHGCEVRGTVQPLEEIARVVRRHWARLLVDASHTAGQVPIEMDAWGIDLLAASGHRGLLGPAGTGVLLLGEGIRLTPFREGRSGGGADLTTQSLDLPWALEAGMPNLPGIAGLRAGVEYLRRETVARIRDRQSTLIKRFIGAIGLDERFTLYAARGDVPRTGAVSFSLKGFAPGQELRIP